MLTASAITISSTRTHGHGTSQHDGDTDPHRTDRQHLGFQGNAFAVQIGFEQRAQLRMAKQPGMEARRASCETRSRQQEEWSGGHDRQENADDAQADACATNAQQQVA